MPEVPVDPITFRLIERDRGPMTHAEFIRAAVYQFIYANGGKLPGSGPTPPRKE